jgi:hypothetical protein
MIRQGTLVRLGAACLLALGLACVPGCGQAKGTLTGKATLKKDGTPLTEGTTITIWTSDNRSVQGLVGKDGLYSVPDVPVGDVKITLTPASDLILNPGKQPGDKGETKKKPITIPLKYTKQAETPLHTTIQKGENTYPIEVE